MVWHNPCAETSCCNLPILGGEKTKTKTRVLKLIAFLQSWPRLEVAALGAGECVFAAFVAQVSAAGSG